MMDEEVRARLDVASELCALGLQCQQARQLEQAQQFYRQCLSYDPNNITALNNLATLLSDNNEWQVAEMLFRRVLAIKPDESNYVTNLSTTLLRREAYAEAEEIAWRAIGINEGDAVAYRNLGLCAYHTGQSRAS